MRCPLQQYTRNPAVQVIEVLDNSLQVNCSISANLSIIGPETNQTITDKTCYNTGEYFFNYTINNTGLFTFTPIVSDTSTNETCKVIVIDSRKTTIPDSNYLSITIILIICAAIYMKKLSSQERQE